MLMERSLLAGITSLRRRSEEEGLLSSVVRDGKKQGSRGENRLAGTLRRELHCIASLASDASDCQLFATGNVQPRACLTGCHLIRDEKPVKRPYGLVCEKTGGATRMDRISSMDGMLAS